MSSIRNGMPATELAGVSWLKSQPQRPDRGQLRRGRIPAGGDVALRNSRHPDGPALVFTRAEWEAFLGGAGDGEFGRTARARPAAGDCTAARIRRIQAAAVLRHSDGPRIRWIRCIAS